MTPVSSVTPVAATVSAGNNPSPESSLSQATVVSMPERLAEVPRALTLGAMPIAVADDGVVQVRTAMGDLFLRSTTAVPLNRPLTLHIPAGSPPQQVFFSAPPIADSSEAAPPVMTAPAFPQIQPPSQIKPGMVVPGLLFPDVQPDQGLLGADRSNPVPSSGSGPALPRSEPAAPLALPRGAIQPADAGPIDAPPAAASANGPRPLFATGERPSPSVAPRSQPVTVEIVSVETDGVPDTPGREETRTLLRGVVTGTTSEKRPIIATPQGLIVLDLPAEVVAGEKLILAIARKTAPEAAQIIMPLEFAADHAWPSLADAIGAAGASHSPAASQLRAIMPRPGPELAPAVALFLNALRGAQGRKWPGDPILDALRVERGSDIADPIARDMQWATAQAAEPNAAGWRCYIIPFLDDGQLSRLQLAVRRNSDGFESEDDRREGSTRFVVDVTPSRLGPVQLDGLLGRQRLDMVLRCRRPLTRQVVSDIKDIFSRATDSAGLTGAISVQNTGRDWPAVARRRNRIGLTA